MILNEVYLLDYLIEKGFASLEAMLLSVSFEITNYSQRTRCFGVKTDSLSIFFKQQYIEDNDRNVTFINEVEVYSKILKHLPVAPKYLFYDHQNKILGLEFLAGYNNFDFFIRNNKLHVDNSISKTFVEKLKVLHKYKSELHKRKELPWIFDIYSKKRFRYKAKNKVAVQLIEYIQGHDFFCESIRVISEKYRYNALIHNDLKLTNVLIKNSLKELDVKLIDFEFTTIGDCALDIGTLFSSYLFIYSTERTVNDDIFINKNVIKLFNDIFNGYFRGRDKEKNIFRTINYAAVKLIQFCLESSNMPEANFNKYHAPLQLSYNLLKSPYSIIKILSDNA